MKDQTETVVLLHLCTTVTETRDIICPGAVHVAGQPHSTDSCPMNVETLPCYVEQARNFYIQELSCVRESFPTKKKLAFYNSRYTRAAIANPR